jgi:hypothetical protein
LPCGSKNALNLTPLPGYRFQAPGPCNPDTDEGPPIKVYNGSRVIGEGIASVFPKEGEPLQLVAPGYIVVANSSKEADYPWWQWVVNRFTIVSCPTPLTEELGYFTIQLVAVPPPPGDELYCTCISSSPVPGKLELKDTLLGCTATLQNQSVYGPAISDDGKTTCALVVDPGLGSPSPLAGYIYVGVASDVMLPCVAYIRMTDGGKNYRGAIPIFDTPTLSPCDIIYNWDMWLENPDGGKPEAPGPTMTGLRPAGVPTILLRPPLTPATRLKPTLPPGEPPP